MKDTGKTKNIEGQKVPLYIAETLKKRIKKFGAGGAHILLPNKYIDRDAEVNILVPKPFVCKQCIETITREENFSPKKDLCISCYNENKAIESGKCIHCGGPNPEKQYWAMCEKCFNKKEEKEEEKINS